MSTTFRASSKSSKAPTLPPEMYREPVFGKFEGVEAKLIEDSKYDPEAFIWNFGILDDELKPVYDAEADPIVIDKVTSQNLNTKSKTTPGAIKVLKALMTADEFSTFEDRAELDQDDEDALASYDKKHPPVKDEDLLGRIVQLSLFKKESGWPGIEEVTRTKQPKAKG